MIVWPAIVASTPESYEHFRLQEPDEADAERLHVLFSDAAVTQHIPPPPSSVAAWKAWIAATRFWGAGLFDATARAAVDVARTQFHATVLRAWIAADNARAVAAFRRLPETIVTRANDTLCPDGRRGDFVIATIRF